MPGSRGKLPSWTPRTVERDEAIWHAVLAGRTLRSVGEEFGLSRERTRQIYAGRQKRMGLSPHCPPRVTRDFGKYRKPRQPGKRPITA